jgi:hypothetical protein
VLFNKICKNVNLALTKKLTHSKTIDVKVVVFTSSVSNKCVVWGKIKKYLLVLLVYKNSTK